MDGRGQGDPCRPPADLQPEQRGEDRGQKGPGPGRKQRRIMLDCKVTVLHTCRQKETDVGQNLARIKVSKVHLFVPLN